MGFPTWTLWGMGFSILGALIVIGYTLLALSPRFAASLGLGGQRRETRIRTSIGYAFAFLLLTVGFFLAGVPLDAEQVALAPTEIRETLTLTPTLPTEDSAVGIETTGLSTATATDPSVKSEETTTGAFVGPAPATPTATSAVEESTTPLAETPATPAPTVSRTPAPTTTATPTASNTPTATPSATATMTPTPTPTPTPIEGETAVIDTQGSTLWVRRTPGGQQLVIVADQDVVILSTGHAHQGGLLWQEIVTVSGVKGWVQNEFLYYGEEEVP